MKSVYIIAEAGVNHNGSLKLAKDLVRAAARSGADAVKFQTFKAENLVSADAGKADYQKETTGSKESQLEMLKKLELSASDFKVLQNCCAVEGIEFLSSPFDVESLDFLIALGVDKIKIPSGEITNLPFLEKIGQTKMPTILSTGMCDLAEVEQALGVLTRNGTSKDQITVLHCNTEYPTPFEDINLSAMNTMAKDLGVAVGYSDHSLGIVIPIAAVSRGAQVIEKHFTLDNQMEGPDHRASLDPTELKSMVEGIRIVEKALGDGVKRPSNSEAKNIKIARKSIVAKTEIKEGAVFTKDNLAIKRPGDGINPMSWYQVLGSKAKKTYRKDERI